MSNIYWNVVEDKEGIFSDDFILILSSGKDYLNDGYNRREINDFPIELIEEMECVFTWDKSRTKEELIGELKTRKGFVQSKELNCFEDEDEVLNDLETLEEDDEAITRAEYEDEIQAEIDEEALEDEIEEEEEVDEEELLNEEDGEEIEEIEEASTSSSVSIVPKLSIKDWKDLNTIERMYSFLKNYTNLVGMDAPIGKGIPNKNLIDSLISKGILENEYVTEIEKFFKLTMPMQTKKPGSIDSVAEMTLIANGCTEDVATNLAAIYTMNMDKWNNLYLYWLAILGAEDVAYAKTMMKNAMDYTTKKLKTAEALFEFEELEIPTEVVSIKVGGTRTSSTSVVKTTTTLDGDYSWSLVSIATGKIGTIETKETFIGINKVGNTGYVDEIPFEILDVLKIRGVDVSTSPLFRLPSTVSNIESARKLLSGIEGLIES